MGPIGTWIGEGLSPALARALCIQRLVERSQYLPIYQATPATLSKVMLCRASKRPDWKCGTTCVDCHGTKLEQMCDGDGQELAKTSSHPVKLTAAGSDPRERISSRVASATK